jgi:hypothetical protein
MLSDESTKFSGVFISSKREKDNVLKNQFLVNFPLVHTIRRLQKRTIFFFTYSNMGKRGKGENYKGVSVPLLNLIEEMKCETVGMLPNTRWEAAHPATMCASKLAHLDILRALQTFMECNLTRKSKITGADI